MSRSIARASRGRRRREPPGIAYAARIGVRAGGPQELVSQLEAGFPYPAFEKLRKLLRGTAHELARLLDIAPRTLSRRKQLGRFTPKESERLLRLSRVLESSAALFEGDREAALVWLRAPNRALGGEAPLALSKTEPGAREVENLIGRLEHGVFS